MDKLTKKIREVQEEHAEEFVQEHLAHHKQADRDRALLIAGGFKTALKISAAIGSEVMRALEQFQEERLYASFGYDRFADFLDDSEFSPMSKAQYYERKAILDREGDMVFDLLSDLGMSIRRRKLLGKGNVEVHGDKVFVLQDNEQSVEIDLKDRTRLLETLTALADANADKSAKLEKQKAKIEKHDDEKRELYNELDRVKASAAAEIGKDPHSMALANVAFAFAALREQIEILTDVDRTGRRDNALEIIANQLNLTRAAYGTVGRKPAETALRGETAEEVIDNFLEDLDLNDAELAANM